MHIVHIQTHTTNTSVQGTQCRHLFKITQDMRHILCIHTHIQNTPLQCTQHWHNNVQCITLSHCTFCIVLQCTGLYSRQLVNTPGFSSPWRPSCFSSSTFWRRTASSSACKSLTACVSAFSLQQTEYTVQAPPIDHSLSVSLTSDVYILVCHMWSIHICISDFNPWLTHFFVFNWQKQYTPFTLYQYLMMWLYPPLPWFWENVQPFISTCSFFFFLNWRLAHAR